MRLVRPIRLVKNINYIQCIMLQNWQIIYILINLSPKYREIKYCIQYKIICNIDFFRII